MKNKFLFQIVILVSLTVCSFLNTYSQSNLTQTVRGKIMDSNTKVPLIGATIFVEGSNPIIGTTTDLDGNFRLDAVSVGRHNFKVSYLGYESKIISEILVSSGKEVILEIELSEASVRLKEFVVSSQTRKDKSSNSMASVSARTFSVEEASRYAGGMDDPARLASAFAGVATTQTTNNAIIIRGNSPRGVLWRIEGVDVPAAFHFPNVDFVGGGGYTVLSSQMLRNSDFFTGAFPAEYGNAVSGVFDIKLRTGNSEKKEFAAGIGTSGVDFSAEGPFANGKKSTYLFNYRYSTLALLGKLTNFPNLPSFQDLTFKFDFPTKNAGTFTFWGMAAYDTNKKEADSDTLKWKTDYDRTGQDYFNRFGVIGLSHRYVIGNKTFVNSSLTSDGMRYGMDKKEYTFDGRLLPTDNIKSTEGKYSFRTTVNHKFNQRLSSRTGFTFNSLFFDNKLEKAFRTRPEEMITFVNNKGNGYSTQVFSQFKYDLLNNLSVNVGIHSMYLNVNDKSTLEPRAGINWGFSEKDELSLAYGLHSQMEELRTYYSEVNNSGVVETPNTSLDFMKSHHFIIGYSRKINEVLRFKVEPYFQKLENVPVYPNSSFSVINVTSNWAINRKLENLGTGRNYGIDLTFERFLKDGYYYLLTATFFDSKYTGGDGKQYNTQFNRGHVINLLAGKEWMVKNNNVLGVNAKVTYMGGLRYTPALYQESIEAQLYKPDYSKSFESQFPASTGVDLSITYRINKKKYSGIWYLMMKNALLQPDYGDPYFDFISKDVIIDKMRMPFPHVGYKIEF